MEGHGKYILIILVSASLKLLIDLDYQCQTKHDEWAWVGFVLGDFYLLILLIHVSYTWMPRTMSSGEVAKYAPLDYQQTFDDDVWDDEIELSSFDID